MKRTHIHFAPGEPGESGVISGEWRKNKISFKLKKRPNLSSFQNQIYRFEFVTLFSGMRASCDIIIFVDLEKALTGKHFCLSN